MSFKFHKTKVSTKEFSVTSNSEQYQAFPEPDQIAYNPKQLLVVGILNYSSFDKASKDRILIAIPATIGTFYGDEPYLSYSFSNGIWQMDRQDIEYFDDEFINSYQKNFDKAKRFFQQHSQLCWGLDETRDAEALIHIGGQPPLGQNWDAEFNDDNAEADQYFDALDEGSGEIFEDWSNRNITFYDEDSELEFLYIGRIDYSLYLDGGGDCILFYQPEIRRVMAFAEFS